MTATRRSFLRYLGLGAGAAVAAPVVTKVALACEALPPAAPVAKAVPMGPFIRGDMISDGNIMARHINVDTLKKIAADVGPVFRISSDRMYWTNSSGQVIFDTAEGWRV